MREIKFKAISLGVENKWLEGDVRFHNGDTCIFEQGGTKGQQIVNETICQYIGQKDKNGKDIYEGDILRSDLYPFSCCDENIKDNYLAVVFWSEEECNFQLMLFVSKQSKVAGISDFINNHIEDGMLKEFEVIGNVHTTNGMFRHSDEEIMKWYNND